jgi:hypothetical protein
MSLMIELGERCSSMTINIDKNNNNENVSQISSSNSSSASDAAGLTSSPLKGSPTSQLSENRSKSPINVDALNKLLVLSNPNTKLIVKRPESIDVNLQSKENIVEHLGETVLTTPISPASGFESMHILLFNYFHRVKIN